MDKSFVDAWDINNRIHLYLLDSIKPAALESISASKGRRVCEQFSHIHNVRLMWLKSATPELLEGLSKIENENSADRALLKKSLQESGRAISTLLERTDSEGKIKGFKPHAAAFFAYLISHESHHRGQIALTLKQAGHTLDKKIAYGIWEWGAR